MKFCLYSGTFNPIHTAHLVVAEAVKDEIGADKIIFIPSYVPPHKSKDLALPKHRMDMVRLAIKGNESFEASDIEFQREKKSYTYDTIIELQKLYPEIDSKINFIIGTDAFRNIQSWYEVEKLKTMVKFIIVPREENFNTETLFEKIDKKDFDYQVLKIPFLNISSSLIRQKVAAQRSIKYLVSKEVEDYINENGVFK